MNTRLLHRLLLIVLAGAMTSPVARGQTSVRYYRYEVLTRAQEFAYMNEVPSGVRGRHHLVETDPQGRIIHTATMRGGQKISERVYVFAPGEKAASEYETFTGSERTSRVRIQRNAAGNRTREDYFTVTGALTGYTLYTYRTDSVEAVSYTRDGKKRSAYVSAYSVNNILNREITYSNPDDRSFHVISDFDDKTGLRKGSAQYEDGRLTSSGAFSYDDGGDLVRQDMFDPSGNWFAAAELVDGLTSRRLYDSTKELRYSYDERRRVKETTLFYDGMLVCRFTYDRLSNGTVTRTLAFGPDGALWAEYPDMEVVDVRQDGHPINGRPAIIKKAGNWY